MKTKEKVQIQLLPSDLLDPPNGGHNKPWKRSLKTANLGHLEEPGNWILYDFMAKHGKTPRIQFYPFVHLCDRLSSLLLVVRSKEFLGIFMFVVVVVCSSFGKKIEDPVASYVTDGR